MKKFRVSFPYFLEYPVKIFTAKIGLLGFLGWFFQKFGKKLIKGENIIVSERIIEIPKVHSLVGAVCQEGCRILEIGHVNSSLALELANLGYQVTAIDIRDYPFKHQNLTSIRGDFLNHNFPEKFRCIISVSTIEHLGDNRRYGGDEEGKQNLDQLAFSKIKDLLDSDGRFILTVPYAARKQRHWFKVYTRDSLETLLARYFVIEIKRYYFRKDNQWFETTDGNQDPEHPSDGVAIFLLAKK